MLLLHSIDHSIFIIRRTGWNAIVAKCNRNKRLDGPEDHQNMQKLHRTLNCFPGLLYSCPSLCPLPGVCTMIVLHYPSPFTWTLYFSLYEKQTVDCVLKVHLVWRLEVNSDCKLQRTCHKLTWRDELALLVSGDLEQWLELQHPSYCTSRGFPSLRFRRTCWNTFSLS